MFLTSSWFPSRIPVSLVLLPIFWLVLAISPNLNQWRALWVLIIVHGLLYASVNGVNNYFSKKKNIEINQQKAKKYSRLLLIVSISLFVAAITLAFVKVGLLFAILVSIYGFAGSTYSDPYVQWEKYKGVAWVLTGIIQGIFTLVILYVGINQFSLENLYQLKILFPGLLITLILWTFYPLLSGRATQVKGEARRNFFSIRGNRIFFLAGELFTISIVLTGLYFKVYFSGIYFPPLLLFYGAGLVLLYRYFHPARVNYNAFLSWSLILALNVFSFYLFTDYTHIFQLI